MKKEAWMNMKIKQSDKDMIKAAAALEDRTLSNWVIRVAVREAKKVIALEGS